MQTSAGRGVRQIILIRSNAADRVREHGTPVEFGELTKDYMSGLPQARAAVFDRIEEFLNLHIYDFNVKLHEIQVK